MSTSPDHADSPASLGPKLPFQMGRFTLCRELGAGGMATVYLSKMRLAAGIERLVALKTIHGHLAKEQTFVDMFLDEAKIASHISHPNVCSVYDFGDVGSVYYMAMEYLVGEPLFDFVNAIAEDDSPELREALPFLAARIIADACEGLHAAHTLRGSDGKPLDVVHRDVSPQNLFVTYEGAVKVVDFGCAKALERVTQTNTGIMKGKVSYAAPEQLKQDDEVDARADVWALGVCLWECLTLSQLFRRENAIKTAMAVLEDDIPRADEGHDWVPSKLADIAEKALQRDRADRYRDAREMGKALRGFIARSGAAFESAEVAEWMRYLFPDRHDRVRQVVSEVEKMDVSQVGPVPRREEPEADEGGDDRAAIADAPTRLAKAVPSTRKAVSLPEDLDDDDDDPVVLPTRTGRWVWTVVFLLALAAGGAYAWLRYPEPIRAALGMQEEPEAGDDADTSEQPPDTPETAAGASDEAAGSEGNEPEPSEGPSDAEGAAAEGEDEEEPAEGADEGEGEPEEEAAAAGGSTESGASRSRARGSRRRGRSGGEESSGSSARRGSTSGGSEASESSEGGAEERAPVRPSARLDFSRGPVLVRATGGSATVIHDGRQLGRTPVRVELPVGTQRLRLVPSGGGPARTISVDVEWGSLTTVDVDLSPPSGSTWDNPY